VAQQAQGKTDDALASLEMAAGVETNGTLIFSEIARLQLRVSAARQAKRYLSPESVAASPGAPLRDEVLGAVEEQIANLRAALTEHPRHADWYYRLGVLLRHAGRLPEAIDAFRRAVEINPEYVKALTKLGLALRDAGQDEEAVRVLEKVQSIEPSVIDLHYQLGLVFADRREFERALEHFQRAVDTQPDRLDYAANLALCLQNMGLLEAAHATWQSLLSLQSENCSLIQPQR